MSEGNPEQRPHEWDLNSASAANPSRTAAGSGDSRKFDELLSTPIDVADPRLGEDSVRRLVRQGRYNARGDASREQQVRQLIGALRDARRRRNLTIADVAVRAGVHKSVIGKFENETTDPRLSTLLRYADALNVDLSLTIVDRQLRGQ